MYPDYEDIISRIAEPPSWWSHGVPRYGDFHPSHATIYGSVVVLLEIGSFDREVYRVAYAYDDVAQAESDAREGFFQADDPPNYRTIYSSMLAHQYRVLEFWVREKGVWHRRPELELPLMDFDERP